MLVKGYIQDNNLYIPNIDIKQIKNKKISLKVEIVTSSTNEKLEIIKNTAGILKNLNIDGLDYQNTIRNEWDERISKEVN